MGDVTEKTMSLFKTNTTKNYYKPMAVEKNRGKQKIIKK